MSVYKLSDKVRKNRLKKWICLLLQISVLVGVSFWVWFAPEEMLCKSIIGFAFVTLIEQFRR